MTSPRGVWFPDRTFEAVAVSWEGDGAEAAELRDRLLRLSSSGVDVAVMSDAGVGEVDAGLEARPTGPGRLYLCVEGGSEVFAVGTEGPEPVWSRQVSPQEDAALDRTVQVVAERLQAAGLRAEVAPAWRHRRRVDLLPEPRWSAPGPERAEELLAAVTECLREQGFKELTEVVDLAVEAARQVGLGDPCVTTDLKHVEVGLSDRSDAMRWFLARQFDRGVGSGLVLVAGRELGPRGGVPGRDSLLLLPESARATAVSVGTEPEGVPPGVGHLGGGVPTLLALLDDQLARRALRRCPTIDEDPRWTILVQGDDPELRRVHQSLLCVADGRFGTRGVREEEGPGTLPRVVSAGVYDETGKVPRLLSGPIWTGLRILPSAGAQGPDRRVLDLRTGVLFRQQPGRIPLRTVRFASLARPGTAAMRAEGAIDVLEAGPALSPPSSDGTFTRRQWDGSSWACAESDSGGAILAAARQREHDEGGRRAVERIVTFGADSWQTPSVDEVLARLAEADAVGFERLLAEQRAAWAERWRAADVAIDGDPELELSVRFGLFHLIASVPDSGEAAVGARGLSGPAYAGHVFWDADVFVMPFLAATHPASARAMLEYRIRRLPAAWRSAGARRLAGVRFPWESAREGDDVTPRLVHMPDGSVTPIRTGEHEEHIMADIAWAAWHYVEWSGDSSVLGGEGRALVTDTARYWASRVRFDERGRGHLYGVIGPDEYHEPVDDNAFTNVMARWNLRKAAEVVERDGVGASVYEVRSWREIADSLVDGYDPDTGRYEEFAGFYSLEPLVISELAPTPVAADLLFGRSRIAGSQIVKQPDVLMLHHLVPDHVAAGSLQPNLDFYEPRTAHGSSLSPAIHAALLARAGRPDQALELFRMACRLDLDDLTGTSAHGLHVATFGGVWQAVVYGFAGVRPRVDALRVDPSLPSRWQAVEIRVRFRGGVVRVRAEHDAIEVVPDSLVPIELPDGRIVKVAPPGVRFERRWGEWKDLPLPSSDLSTSLSTSKKGVVR